jgi:hypothetical protein
MRASTVEIRRVEQSVERLPNVGLIERGPGHRPTAPVVVVLPADHQERLLLFEIRELRRLSRPTSTLHAAGMAAVRPRNVEEGVG